jgi:hypothetical protein
MLMRRSHPRILELPCRDRVLPPPATSSRGMRGCDEVDLGKRGGSFGVVRVI